MVATTRKPAHPIKEDLFANGQAYAFSQAVRLLQRLAEGKPVRYAPALSLGFPASDLKAIRDSADTVHLESTFLGLYGVSSPLPSFYTEELFLESRDGTTPSRDFLDVIHHRVYELFAACWKKYRIFFQLAEEQNPSYLAVLFGLLGEEGGPSNASYALLRYTALLGRRPRSAQSLETLLHDSLGGEVPVEIQSFIPRRAAIPEGQRVSLGENACELGTSLYLGSQITDYQSKFRVRLGPMTKQRFKSLLIGAEKEAVVSLIDRFLIDPLVYDFEWILARGEAEGARLGGPSWATLGVDTVLFSGTYSDELVVRA